MRLVVADDSVLLREGLQLLLAEAGHEVVAAVGDGPAYVAAVLDLRPDASIVDVRMPPSHTDEGLRAAVEVRAAWPEARIMVLSQYVEVSYADDLLSSGEGGTGYLLKDRVSDVDDFLARARQRRRRRHGPRPARRPAADGPAPRPARRAHAARARGARADGRGPLQRLDRRGARRHARVPSRSTPSGSSRSSACCRTTPSTAGCRP